MKNIYCALLMLAGCITFTGCLKEDVNFAAGRPNPVASVEVIRSLYKGADVNISPDKIMDATKMAGVVISDGTAKNIPANQFVLQNYGRGNVRGIIVELPANVSSPYAPGDSLIIEISGANLTRSKGSLTLTSVTADKITKAASNVVVKPKPVSTSELASNFSAYESTLVQISADINPTPVAGETYSGSKRLFDGSDSVITLYTDPAATFASNKLPANAAFAGIATLFNDKGNGAESAVKQLRLRNVADVTNASGPLYPNFPENFENGTPKSSYTAGNSTLGSGVWRLDQAIIASEPNDRAKSPVNAVRMQQNLSVSAFLQMMFDLNNGASKVTIWHGSYGAAADAPATWRLEYSTDSGVTWTKTGADVTSVDKNKQMITFLVDIKGKVRFRINKLGPGTSNGTTILNGRLSIDDFAVYQNI
jgi:hypothetical protein